MSRNPFFITAACAAFLLSTQLWPTGAVAQTSVSQPKEGWYTHLVDFDYVRPLAELPKDDHGPLIVDSRPAARRYDNGHIPGAINLPDSQFEKLAPSLLPADRNAPIIFYCQGHECDLSHKSAFKAEALGYTSIKVYAAGQPDWEARGGLVAVSLAHIRKLIDEKADMMLIDARPERTFSQGSLPGAVNISDSKFDKMTDKLPADRNTTLIYFCGGLKCDLSSKSASKARALGYRNVFVFPEGYPAWQAASDAAGTKNPSVQSTTEGVAGAIAIEAGKEKGSISVPVFERIMRERPSQIQVVDVRDAKEVQKGTFPGAINIPIGELEKRLASLPKNKPIVFTCATGARSGEAYDTVKVFAEDIDAYFLDADVSCDSSNACKIKSH